LHCAGYFEVKGYRVNDLGDLEGSKLLHIQLRAGASDLDMAMIQKDKISYREGRCRKTIAVSQVSVTSLCLSQLCLSLRFSQGKPVLGLHQWVQRRKVQVPRGDQAQDECWNKPRREL
jgi:hypothetical protein